MVIIATGGTIQNTARGRVAVETVLDGIRDAYEVDPEAIARLRVTDVLREGAESLTSEHWCVIGEAVRSAASDTAVDGIVVTHGTFTVEETAYFVHLTVGTRKPIVFACSQRKHQALGNDGDRNLVDAIRVAASRESPGRGVTVVLNEEIHCARDVLKSNQRPGGFTSRSLGLLGSIESDRVSWYRSPLRRHTFRSAFRHDRLEPPLPRVDIVATYPGADGAAVRAFQDAGAAGIVVSGFAFSGSPFSMQEPDLLRAVAAGIAVVVTSRGGDGRIPLDGPVSERFVRGDSFTPQKARVLLMTALSSGHHGRASLQRIFDEH